MSALGPWRRVAAVDIARGERELVREADSIVWQLRPGVLGGVGAFGTVAEIRLVERFFDAWIASGVRASFVGDVRWIDLRAPGPSLLAVMREVLLPRLEAFRAVMMQHSTLVLDDWSLPFWTGMDRVLQLQWPSQIFTERAAQCAWLGLGPEEAADIDALTEREIAAPPLIRALTQLLEERPELDAAAAAQALGRSTRTLQRELAELAASSTDLRARAREARAARLLAASDLKVEAIASDVGFASTAHFVTWFRERRGLTPSAFRDTFGPRAPT